MRVCLLLASALLCGGGAQAEVLYHWTMPIGEDRQSFRAVVTDETCPTIVIDGQEEPMRLRVGPTDAFPNSVCVHERDRGIRSATVGERSFPLSPLDAQRILVVGDTGCRLRQGFPVQNCALPDDWPFAEVATSLAQIEADLAIHVGDYHYRETACADPALCGVTYGYNWPSWEADFFKPGQTMLSAHPFVFVRGNHEKCGRAWMGYLRYLSTEPIDTPLLCDNYYAAFLVGFESLQLAVLDSSTRNRSDYTWDRLRAMRDQFMQVSPLLDRESWVVTHAPLWGYGATAYTSDGMGTLETIQREAFGNLLPRLVTAVVAGDIHFGQLVSTEGNPVQITFGNGGVALYTTPSGLHRDLEVGHGVTGDLFGYEGFGFGLIERDKPGSPVTFFDQAGAEIAGCEAESGADSCTMK